MNYGLYISATGAIMNMHRQEVIANNLANVNTVGFKPDAVYFAQRLPERLENPTLEADRHALLERLGGGALLAPSTTLHQQGPLLETGNSLDVAIHGEGFLAVQQGDLPGPESLRLSRDGRLTLNSTGELVTAAGGMRVLSTDRTPIQIDPQLAVEVLADGQIVQQGRAIATIALLDVPDRATLRKQGENTFQPATVALPTLRPAGGKLVQHAVEGSSSDPVLALNALIESTRASQMNLKFMQYADHIMGQAVTTFGRVA